VPRPVERDAPNSIACNRIVPRRTATLRTDVLAGTSGLEEALTDEPPADPLALEQQVCFALSIAARSVVGVYRPLLEPMGLTHPQYLVMLALWQHAPLSVKDLGRLLQLDSGTLSPLLKRLEASGLVRRQRDAGDERLVTVTLTEEGRRLREGAERIPHEVVRRLGVDLEELQNLHVALTRLIAAAGAAAGPD
jgi:MarR family transcriptional regulator, organic hydroperoxide resistance regulator